MLTLNKTGTGHGGSSGRRWLLPTAQPGKVNNSQLECWKQLWGGETPLVQVEEISRDKLCKVSEADDRCQPKVR